MKLEFSPQIFEIYSNIKFHENASSGSRVVPCGRTDTTKLRVALGNFAKASKRVWTIQGFQKTAVPEITTLDMRDGWICIQLLLHIYFLTKALCMWFLVDTAIGTKFQFPTARVAEDSSILGVYVVSNGKWLPTFQKKNISPSNTRSSSNTWFTLLRMFTLKKVLRSFETPVTTCQSAESNISERN